MKNSLLHGVIRNIDGDIIQNVPIRFEVLTADPSKKAYVRSVTNEEGYFSLYWDELLRRVSQKPIYVMHVNYARDYLRNDEYEYGIKKCLINTSGKAERGSKKTPFISPSDTTIMDFVLGHYLWVKTARCNVRASPSVNSEETAELYRATKVILVEARGDWLKVKIPTNDLNSFPIYDKVGWVYKPLVSEKYIPPVSYKERQREELISHHPEWPKKFVRVIREGNVEEGMSKEMVRASWGDPVNSVTEEKKKRDPITKWEFGTMIKKTVIFKNDKVKNLE